MLRTIHCALNISRPGLRTLTAMAPYQSSAQAFIADVNTKYEKVHMEYEDQFWGTKMALSSTPKVTFSAAELTRTKNAMEGFLSDPALLEETRHWLSTIKASDDDTRKCLEIFERTFKCYIMESEKARKIRDENTEKESKLEEARNNLELGAVIDGKFVKMSSVGLRTKMRTDSVEANRKACWESLAYTIGDFICDNGFVELVKRRNEMAKALGYEDFYEYKVTQAEGFGKKKLFGILDTLEEGTRGLLQRARSTLAKNKGESALQPWNMAYAMAGDVTAKLDPYFPFGRAVEMWGRSFNALGIKYRGAEMNLDLLDRQNKYSNGFCHWPVVAWQKPDGSWKPSKTNFTSLADPAAIGSGHTALATLMHEAGHAAHFANIVQPSPLFGQERAPTSVAYAENQSMFLDSLVEDAAWQARYARDKNGTPIPWSLIEESIRAKHDYAVFGLRAMIAVPYFEKALYELPESEVTAERIKSLAKEIEEKIQGGPASRPLLSVPHIMSDESSCYYHGYVLAEMSVHQTRKWFFDTHGYIVDNPIVGPTLEKAYWNCGNGRNFLDIVRDLTGADLTGESWTAVLEESVDSVVSKEKVEYEKMMREQAPFSHEDIDLNMTVRFVDGDTLIADSSEGGFLESCSKFEQFVAARINKQ